MSSVVACRILRSVRVPYCLYYHWARVEPYVSGSILRRTENKKELKQFIEVLSHNNVGVKWTTDANSMGDLSKARDHNNLRHFNKGSVVGLRPMMFE
jgi:hypothetical protein